MYASHEVACLMSSTHTISTNFFTQNTIKLKIIPVKSHTCKKNVEYQLNTKP
jgi:hypothetical protein